MSEVRTVWRWQGSAATTRLSWDRLLSLLFFCSGFPALIYQLVWQRALFRIFGVNIESVTIVVTAFMIGLGLGSLFGGILATRYRASLLPLLAVIEASTAVFGLFSLKIFAAVGALALNLSLPETALLTLALVLVPTLLMGATLPILAGELARFFENTGRSMGLLYYVNTLGAGAACLVSLAVLFPFLGMAGSVQVAAVVNLLIAGIALTVPASHAGPSRDDQAEPANAPNRIPRLAFGKVLCLAAAGGFASLSYEIYFFRVQSFVTGGSASAFAATLGIFLVGLASGSRRAGELATRDPDQLDAQSVLSALLSANIVGLLYLPAIDAVAGFGKVVVGFSLVFVFLVARSWGMVLPLLAHLGIAADRRAGLRISYLYVANIIGAASGSIITGFVLMQNLTLIQLAQVLIVMGILCSAGTACAADLPQSRRLKYLSLSLCLLAAACMVPSFSPLLLERLQFKEQSSAKEAFARTIENRSGIVAVDAHATVWGHGMYDGRFNTSLMNDVNGIIRPYALSLFHPAPKKVLMIGLASGSWGRVLASHPSVESLTIVEINPAYTQLVSEDEEVKSLLADSKVKIIIDDGRRWLLRHPDEKFDAVIANTTWYFRANTTNLLSTEYVRLVANHLTENGIFYYNTTESTRAQRTACLTMPYGLRFMNHMVVSKAPIDVDFQRWRNVLENYRIDGKLVVDPSSSAEKDLLDNLMELRGEISADDGNSGSRHLEPCALLLARTDGQIPFTDDNMGSEWRHGLGLD
jgi:spermidine synthase